MRYFHNVAMGIDPVPVVDALSRMPELWNADPIRTAHPQSPHYGLDDILLRFEDTAPFHAGAAPEESLIVVNQPAMYLLPQVRPIIFGLMLRLEGEALGRVVISRMAPGKSIPPHSDLPPHCPYYSRYQVILSSNDDCEFWCNGEVCYMPVGSVWFFRNDLEHSVYNHGQTDRIAMVIDIRTFK